VIRVVDSLDDVTERDIGEVAKAGRSSSTGGSCCSAGGPGGGAGSGGVFSLKDLRIPTERIGVAKIENGVQYVSIDALAKGYSPSVVVMQKGVPTKWTFEGKELTEDNYRILFPAYRAKLELAKGDNTIEFTPEDDFIFYGWKNSLFGYVEVIDRLADADVRETRAKVERFIDEQRRLGAGRT
jgi:hypothetical protein